jgi:hypothetical protein
MNLVEGKKKKQQLSGIDKQKICELPQKVKNLN